MRAVVRSVLKSTKSIRQRYASTSPRTKLQLALVLALIGLLAFVLGIYNTVDTTNKFNDLDAIPTPDAETVKQMSQAELMTVAQVGMAKRDLLTRRAQASSLIGVGAALLGIATLIWVNIPDKPTPATSPTSAPSAASPLEDGATAGAVEAQDANESQTTPF
jgi:hypothetical protein